MGITKSDVYTAMKKLQLAAMYVPLMPGDPPDSAYKIHASLSRGSLDTINKYRDEIVAERYKSIRRMPVRIPINPKLPKNFENTCNGDRPKSHDRWWYRSFIRTTSWEDVRNTDEDHKNKWFEHFPSGVRYDVCCLDGETCDSSTFHGAYPTLEEAVKAAKSLAEGYELKRQYRKLVSSGRLFADLAGAQL